MAIDLNNINKGDGVGVEKDANNANTRINDLAGFGIDYGQQEARLALALSDAGGGTGGGGGGGGITQAQVQTAMINALQSQNQVEFQEIVLQDANNILFISSRQINEETGAITVSTRRLDGTAFAPVSPISIPNDSELVAAATNSIFNSISYITLDSGVGFTAGNTLTKYFTSDYTTPGSESFVRWYNETAGHVLISTPPTNVTLAKGLSILRGVSTSASTVLIKTTNAFIKELFVDNLATGIIFIQIFELQTGAPTAGAIPLESYRVHSNGSLSLEINQVYLGQVYIGFSSTAGTFTASTNSRNYNISYD